jgi:hypothetical protein
VIELPRFNAAINIHDAFVNRVFNRTNTTYAHSELDFLTCLFENYEPVHEPPFQDLPNTDQEIQERIAQEMQRQNPSTTSSSSSQKPFQKQELAVKWGLDKLFTWKLSREFAVAHPELDCSSSESNVLFRYPFDYFRQVRMRLKIYFSHFELPHVQLFVDSGALRPSRI